MESKLEQLMCLVDKLDALLISSLDNRFLGPKIRNKSHYRQLMDRDKRDLLFTANGRGYFVDANWDVLVRRFLKKNEHDGITDISGGLSLTKVDFAGNREVMFVSDRFMQFVNKEFEKEKRFRASSVMGDDDQTGNYRDGPPRKPAKVPRV